MGGSLVCNSLRLFASRAIFGGSLLACAVLVARGSGVDPLGRFGLAVTIGTLASALADMGLSQYLVPRLAPLPREQWPAIWREVTAFYRRSALPFGTAFVVVFLLVYPDETGVVVVAAVPWWLLTRATLGARAVLTAAEELGPDARAATLEGLLAIAGVAATIAATGSSALAVLSLSAGAAGGLAIRLRAVNKLLPERASESQRAGGVVRAAASFNVFTFLAVVYLRVDVVLLSLIASTAAVGLYQAPVRFVTAVLLLPEAITPLLLGRVARRPGDPLMRARQERLLAIGVPLGLLLTLVVAWAGDDLLGLLYGSEFEEAGLAFTLLMALLPVRLVNYLNGNELVAHGLMRQRVACIAVTAVFAVVAGTVAIALEGYVGAAAVSLGSEVLLGALYAITLRRSLGPHAIVLPRLRRSPSSAA